MSNTNNPVTMSTTNAIEHKPYTTGIEERWAITTQDEQAYYINNVAPSEATYSRVATVPKGKNAERDAALIASAPTLKAENERMRAELEEIAQGLDDDSYDDTLELGRASGFALRAKAIRTFLATLTK